MSALAVLALVGCKNEPTLNDAGESLLTLDDPTPAEWFDVGTVSVSGEWAALSDLSVNGTDAEVSGTLSGTYSADIDLPRGITVVEASGVDSGGDRSFVKHGVIAGEFLSPQPPVNDAAIVRINEGGLAVITRAVEAQVTPELLTPLLVDTNPLYTGSFLEIAGEDRLVVELGVNAVDFSFVDFDVTPQQDKLSFVAEVGLLQLDTTVGMEIFGGQFFDPVGVDLSADLVTITGDLTLSADGQDIVVIILSSQVEIDDFFFDTDFIPGGFEGALLSGAVEGVVESQVAGLLEDQIGDLVARQLSAFDLSFETELLGKAVSVNAGFAAADIDDAGIELVLDTDVEIAGDNGYPYRGVITSPGLPPTPDTTADVSVAIWDDLINRLLFEAWRSGMLDLRLSTDDGSLEPVFLAPLRADGGTISMDAKLPPVALERDGQLIVQMAELEVTIDTEGSDLGDHIVVAVAAEVPVDVVVVNGQAILDIGDPELDLMVRESDWGASNEATSELLADVIPVDVLLSALGSFGFPIPDLIGIEVNAGAIRDDNGTHTTIGVDLSLPDAN